jgi:hypothetical protein
VAAAALGLLLLAQGGAEAGIIIKKATTTGGDPIITFLAGATANTEVERGDFFTVYDVSTVKPTEAHPVTNWLFFPLKLGPTPDDLEPTDSKTLWNVAWIYTGVTPLNFPNPGGIANFSFHTTDRIPLGTTFTYAQQSHILSTGAIDISLGTTPPLQPTPEPATLLLAATSLPLLYLWRTRRRSASAK